MKNLMIVTTAISLVLMTACASSPEQADNSNRNYESELAAQNQEINKLKQELAKSSQARNVQMSAQNTNLAGTSGSGDLLPPNAKPGQCFARVYIPPAYKTEAESILKAEGYDVVEVIPAVYGTEKTQVRVREATEVIEVIPAVYGWREEQVLVSPAITELRRVPAKYGFEQEQILVKPAHSIWKKGTGPITKVDQTTGEIMCLVEVPASYKTIKKRVLITPETTQEVAVQDAIYKTIKTRIVEQPAKTVTKEIPAVYASVAVKKLLKEADTKVVKIPPVYETLEKRIKTSDGNLEWASILCETNVTGKIVSQLQQTLNEKGYNAGPVDGLYGWQTGQAVRKYQADNTMRGNGRLTIELVDALAITY